MFFPTGEGRLSIGDFVQMQDDPGLQKSTEGRHGCLVLKREASDGLTTLDVLHYTASQSTHPKGNADGPN